MGSRLRAHSFASLSMLVCVLVLVLVAVWVGPAGAVDGGPLENLGFEDGLEVGWFPPETPDPGAAVVVGAEDWEQFDVYTTMGVPAHDPDEGQYFLADGGGLQMLRLGVPKNKDSHQIKGPVSVSQEFVSDGRPISLVYRIFTWEHRSQDAFVIGVKKADGTYVGKIADGVEPGPYEVFPEDPVKPYKFTYSEWSEIDITGLPGTTDAPETLTLSYTLSNAKDAAHDTWVYVDHVNHPPVAVFEWAPNDPAGELPHEGDVIGLYGDQSYDPDGSVDNWRWDITNLADQTVSYNDTDGDPNEFGPNDFLSPVGFIVPPNGEDTYHVKLTVWDKEGLSDTTEGYIRVQNSEPRVNALNIIEVLSGSKGQLVGRFVDPGWEDKHKATWTWKPEGSSDWEDPVRGDVQEDNLAPVSSGYVGGTFDAETKQPGAWDLTLKVDDLDGGVGTDPDKLKDPPDQLKVLVIEPEPGRFEPEQLDKDDPDEFPDQTVQLPSDGAYLSYIQSQGDVDIFEVRLPDGDPLLMGTEVLVTLRDLPADYDLVVFEGVEGSGGGETPQEAPFIKSRFQPAAFMHSPFDDAGFMHSAFMNSGFMHSAFMHSPFAESAFMHSGFMHSAFMHSAFMHSEYAGSAFMHSPIDGYPLSAMSFTGTEHDNTSGTDISFDELGFDLEALPQDRVQNLRVLGFSANSGAESEVVLATAGYPQTVGEIGIHGHVYVAVKSATGAYSTSSPYTLQIETSSLLDPLAVDLDAVERVVPADEVTTAPEVIYERTDKPLTLFVTQFERLESLYGLDGRDLVEQKLRAVALRDDVKGKIISVPANLYADYVSDEALGWDDKPWLVERANEVAQSIRGEIRKQLDTDSSNSDIQYVVLVGNDRIIPFRRLVDQTIIGNEQNYTDQSFLKHPSATLASIANGYILTDDYYVDAAPISWGGSYLYIPDMAISRLVETPEEIAGTVQAFRDANGIVQAFTDPDGSFLPGVGLVSGYDFMADGAENVRRILSEAGLSPFNTVELIKDNDTTDEKWTGDDLRNRLITDALDVANINAHFTHFAGLSSNGYSQSVAGTLDDVSEFLLSGEIADARDAAGNKLFRSKLLFSMGCHAGLNVPDEEAVKLSPEDKIVPALDFPQAMMQQGGIYLGSTGFGYGDTVGIAGTEALIGFFAKQLVGGADLPPAASVGLALAKAKQDYLGSLSSLTPYDQKSSVQFTLYGMPQYYLPQPSSVSLAAANETGTYLDEFQLSLNESSMENPETPPSPLFSFSQSYGLVLQTGDTGDYITAKDYIANEARAEATPDRPIHPVAPVDLNDRLDQGPAHGFVYTEGSYYSLPETFHPAIARATTEWEEGAAEFQVATSEFWPVEPGSLTTRETSDGGYDQTFVAVPAQFKPEAGEGPIVGTERVWSSLVAEVLTSTDEDDWLAPTVSDVDVSLNGAGLLNVSVEARDSTRISRIVVLQMGPERMYIPDNGDQTFDQTPGVSRYELANLRLEDGEGPEDIALLIQVVDGNGNVTRLTGRGALFGLRQPFNLGFEYGLNYWDVTEPVLGNASIVPSEDDPTEPYTGQQMLRLGTPTDKDSHQVKGTTSVSQGFVADGGDIVVAYLLATDDNREWEFDDEFTISVTDEEAPEPNVAYSERVWNTEVTGDWVRIAITGLTAGKSYTLTYTLDTTNSAAKNTWVYVDQGS